MGKNLTVKSVLKISHLQNIQRSAAAFFAVQKPYSYRSDGATPV